MKNQFDPQKSVHILNSSADFSEAEPEKSSFDITKVLQILKSLNLNGLFPSTSPNREKPQENFAPTINFNSNHNQTYAKNKIEAHREMVKNLKGQ